MGFGITALVVILLMWGGWHLALLHALRAPRSLSVRLEPGMSMLAIDACNGRRLNIRWWPQADATAPVIVIMHGWGGHGGELIEYAAPLHAAGYALLLPDARCHGHSDDDRFASLPRFAEDLESALDWLYRRHPVTRCILAGHSVGASACLLVASRRRDIAAVISIAAFAHPAEMMRRWLARYGLAGRWLARPVLAYVEMVIGHRFDRIAAIHTASAMACPLLIVHGAEDQTVPVENAWRIAAAAATSPVVLHADHEHFDAQELAQAIFAFLDRYPTLASAGRCLPF